jgi:hypothetical protein
VVVHVDKGAPPRSRTSRCSVADITARCTRKAIRSIDSLTARSASGDRTAGRYPRSRPRPSCLPTRSRPFERTTPRRGSACTRGRHARPGWGSAWMWSTRSTCYIPWPTDSRARQARGQPAFDGMIASPAVASNVERNPAEGRAGRPSLRARPLRTRSQRVTMSPHGSQQERAEHAAPRRVEEIHRCRPTTYWPSFRSRPC